MVSAVCDCTRFTITIPIPPGAPHSDSASASDSLTLIAHESRIAEPNAMISGLY